MPWRRWKFYKYINLIIVFIIFLFFVGCASMSRFKEVEFKEYKEDLFYQSLKKPIVGEKLEYRIYWTGIPAGKAILQVKEITEVNGNEVFHIVARVYSNRIFSIIYKTDDVFHSYIDKKGLFSRAYRLERRGRKKEKESVLYNYKKLKARITSNNGSKIMDIPGKIQDALSCLYYFRTKKIELGDKIVMDVNADEKNWQLEYYVKKFGKVNLLGIGIFNSFLIKLKAKHKDKYRKDRKMEVWITSDKRKIPLLISIDVPLGYMRIVLSEIEIQQ